MKKIIWKENFIDVTEEYLDDLKRDYYMALGAYKQKLSDVKTSSELISNSINDKHIINLVVSMLAKRSTVGTEELEGYKPDIVMLEENLFENKFELDDDSNVSLSIFKMYLNYTLPEDIITLDTIKEIHRNFFITNKINYKAGKLRNKNDSNVFIPNSNKLFIESRNVEKYMNKFIPFLNGFQKYDPVTRVAMIHGILLGIHPFRDGNGRITRFITDKLLSRELEVPLFLSEAINSRATDSAYALALDAFHLNLDSLPLIRYFYEIAINQLKLNIKIIDDYINEYTRKKYLLLESGFKLKYAHGLAELLSTHELIRKKNIESSLEVTAVTASTIINKLIERKIIKKHKEHGRSVLYKVIKAS